MPRKIKFFPAPNRRKGLVRHNFLPAKNYGGFTIIEVLIALFIVGLTLIIFSVASNSVILNRETARRDIAHRIAASEMQDLRGTPYASLPPSGSFSSPLLPHLPEGQASRDVTDYNPDTRQVTVTVTWREPGSAAGQSLVLTTLITKN